MYDYIGYNNLSYYNRPILQMSVPQGRTTYPIQYLGDEGLE